MDVSQKEDDTKRFQRFYAKVSSCLPRLLPLPPHPPGDLPLSIDPGQAISA